MANEQYKIVLTISGDGATATAAIDNVNKKLKENEQATEQAANTSKTLGQQWDSFKNMAGNLLGAATIVTALTAKVYDLGHAAEATETTFNQVSGGADLAAASLARMRQLTGGVIDDMSLMKGASSLLVTGVAQTNEQAEKLVNLGARLGTVMGVDATESIQNLNAALLNNSFNRLDTLGISAAKVRERVNELKEAGMDMSAAFAQAVTEIGTDTLEKLGDAANTSETAIARLTVRMQNLGTQGAEFVAGKLDEAATSLEQLITLGDLALGGTGGIPALEEQRQQYADLIAIANQYQVQRDSLLKTSGVSFTDSGLSTGEAYTFSQNNQQMFSDISSGTYFQDAFASLDPERINDARVALTLLRPEWAALNDEQLKMYSLDIDNTFKAVADAETALTLETQATNDALEEQNRQMQAVQDSATDFSVMEASGNALAKIGAEYGNFTDLVHKGTFTIEGRSFLNPDTLAEVQSHAEAVTAEYERLKSLAESSDYTLVSEFEVERAKEIAANAESMADDAERMATAWDSMSLSQLAGEGNGGQLGEFYQGVLGQIEDPELRAKAEQQFALASGQRTATGDVLDYGQQLVATITDEQGIAAGQRAGQTFLDAFKEGLEKGLTGEALQDYVENQVGYALDTSGTGGGNGEDITVQPGEGYLSVAARTGYSVDELKNATGGGMLLAGQVISVGDGTSLVAVNGEPEDIAKDAADNVVNNALDQVYQNLGMNPPTPNGQVPFTQTPEYLNYMGGGGTGQTLGMDNTTGEVVHLDETDVENVQTVEESLSTIATTDTSLAFDPMITDVDTLNTNVATLQTDMNRLTDTEYNIEVPIKFVFDTQTAEMLSRNSQVVETVRLILPQLGISPS